MYLGELHARLIGLAQRRVRTGEVTERGLARRCGMSQPHLHNVLKHVRALSNDAADRLMQALDVTIADLLWTGLGDAGGDLRVVPIARNRLGPGADAVLAVHRGTMALPASLVTGLVDPVAARLAPDLALPRGMEASDLVLLDQNPVVRSNARGGGLWVVAEAGGLRVRYLRAGGTLLYIANEANLEDPRRWLAVSPAERDVLEVVVARVVWLSRKLVEEPVATG